MSIKIIEIKNFKSIEYVKLNIDQLSIFIGKNGTGKTTIQKAIKYFYDNLIEENYSSNVIDVNNKYKNYMEITITYDFSSILSRTNGTFHETIRKMLRTNNGISNGANTISLTLKQDRKGRKVWSREYQHRYIIKNTQPIYFIKAREKNIRDWDDLWDVFGGYINANAGRSISKGIKNTLPEKLSTQFQEYVAPINTFLKEQDIQIKEQSNTEKIINFLKLYFGGEDFESNKKSLDFFSEGTNSKNYITFMSFIAYITSLKRLKEATVVIDEPEMGLHLKMIDTLMDSLVDYSKKVNFILLTHSPRLASIGLKEVGKIYKVSSKKDYTVVKQIIKKSNDIKQLMRLSDTESGMLFSDFLLFVEGISEYELFTHKGLKTIFPILKEVDVVNTNSDNPVINLLVSSGVDIPYVNIIDIDKILNFTKQNSNIYKMNFKKYGNCLIVNDTVKEYMRNSFNKYSKILEKNQNIEKLNNTTLNSMAPVGVRPLEFRDTFNLMRYVCNVSNIYLNKVDIEYVLSCSIPFDEWFLKYKKCDNNDEQMLANYRNHIEINILRTWLVKGKDEFLNKLSDEDIKNHYNDFYDKFNNKKINKASGWITNYLDYYFEKNKAMTKNNLIKQFKIDFQDLYDIIKTIEEKRNE
ncbi:retron Eco8 family effector endonuclease [uncultured Granulicatella sp.]|uniref:retron Eco8 family effector endonuclease n=1 Tax=uncultured Granulicatella sp. TaxID=316089 RepID=UPI00263A2298|nr:retron Eco8 family effector endonuclease [uncultured Granulicatella sp.]